MISILRPSTINVGNCQNKGYTKIKYLNMALGHHELPEHIGIDSTVWNSIGGMQYHSSMR
jgi:hypothetical protein